jgi:hypothetical protein
LRRITGLFTHEENKAFRTTGYAIGGMMIFPGNRIDGKADDRWWLGSSTLARVGAK